MTDDEKDVARALLDGLQDLIDLAEREHDALLTERRRALMRSDLIAIQLVDSPMDEVQVRLGIYQGFQADIEDLVDE